MTFGSSSARGDRLGFAAAHRFVIIDADGFPLSFELEQKKEAGEFRKAFGRRLVGSR